MILREAEVLREAALRNAQHSLAGFLRLMWPVWGWGKLEWAPHLDVFCLVFEQWLRGMQVEDPEHLGLPIQVIANVPPQTSKTTVWGRAGLLYAQMQAGGRLRLLHASHTLEGNLDTVEDERMQVGTSRRFLDLVDASGRPWRWGKSDENGQATTTGGRIALTSWYGGAATGRHFNGHYYDDLCKAKHVYSDKARSAWRRMLDELASRYAQRLRHMFLAMQRLAWNDPVADVAEEYPEAVHLVLPRVYEIGRTDYPEQLDLGVPSEWTLRAFDGAPLQRGYLERLKRAGFWLETVNVGGEQQRRLRWRDWRRPGQHLDPARFGPADEKRHRRNLRRWLAEQQQRPSRDKGAAIVPASSWKLWPSTPPTRPAEVIITLDPQDADPSRRASPDRTALLVGARWGGSLYALERVNGEHTITQVIAMLMVMQRRWGAHRLLIEDAAAGSAILTQLRGEGLPILLVRPEGSTPGRLLQASASIIAGNVLLPVDDAPRPPFLRPSEPWPGRIIRYDDVPGRLRPNEGVVETLAMPAAPAPAVWRPEFVEEIASIPGGPYDDDGDSISYMVADLQARLGERRERSSSRPRHQPASTAARRHGVVGARTKRPRWS